MAKRKKLPNKSIWFSRPTLLQRISRNAIMSKVWLLFQSAVEYVVSQMHFCLYLGSSPALESCNEALAIDGSHVKSLLRRAQAYNAKAEYALCRADLDAALRTEPENKSALSLLKVVKAKLKQIQKKERKTFSGIFEKLSALNEKEEGVKNAASPVIGSAKETVTQGSGDTQDPIAPSPWDREA